MKIGLSFKVDEHFFFFPNTRALCCFSNGKRYESDTLSLSEPTIDPIVSMIVKDFAHVGAGEYWVMINNAEHESKLLDMIKPRC